MAAGAEGANAFTTALQNIQTSQAQELEFQTGLNESKSQFQAESASLQMEDAMASKMANLVSAQAQALAR